MLRKVSLLPELSAAHTTSAKPRYLRNLLVFRRISRQTLRALTLLLLDVAHRIVQTALEIGALRNWLRTVEQLVLVVRDCLLGWFMIPAVSA